MMPDIIVTRPKPDNQTTADRLRDIGFSPVLMPLLTFKLIKTKLLPAINFGAIAVTSANSLVALREIRQLKTLLPLPLFAVGEKTANIASEYGFNTVFAAKNSLSSLARLIDERKPEQPVLYPCARHRSGDLKTALSQCGIKVELVEIYEMAAIEKFSAQQINFFYSSDIKAATFYSLRTAKTFLDLCQQHHLNLSQNIVPLCLSEKIAAPLFAAGFQKTGVADAPKEEAMIALALSFSKTERK